MKTRAHQRHLARNERKRIEAAKRSHPAFMARILEQARRTAEVLEASRGALTDKVSFDPAAFPMLAFAHASRGATTE
jgi:hypothetical protein